MQETKLQQELDHDLDELLKAQSLKEIKVIMRFLHRRLNQLSMLRREKSERLTRWWLDLSELVKGEEELRKLENAPAKLLSEGFMRSLSVLIEEIRQLKG